MENNEEIISTDVVEPNIARKDVESWLNAKRIPAGKRQKAKEIIGTLEQAVSDGLLIWDEDKRCLTQVLLWPLGDNEDIKTIEYKNRVTQGDISARMGSVKVGEGDMSSKVMGIYLSAISGLPTALVDKLDTVDYNVSQAVISFFM